MEKEYLAENAMTTDPFNTADTYHDEMPHHLADYCEHAGVGKACRRCRRKFDAASQWTRDFLYSKEPTDAECTAVLNAVTTPLGEEPKDGEWFPAAIQRCRDTMMSARAVRRDEEKRNG